uniref:Uncharacterized protein n=1 Tax=Rhizophora mucronata TaxID=61149 RepID=A0A2P2R5B3_RHIMU
MLNCIKIPISLLVHMGNAYLLTLQWILSCKCFM